MTIRDLLFENARRRAQREVRWANASFLGLRRTSRRPALRICIETPIPSLHYETRTDEHSQGIRRYTRRWRDTTWEAGVSSQLTSELVGSTLAKPRSTE